MRNLKRTSLPLFLILLGVLACALPATSQVDQNAAGTAVARTLAVIIQMTQDAGSGIAVDASATPAATLIDTLTPELPTFTQTASLTPAPTLTFTPLIPMISVSVATNCRLGPGKAYRMVGALPVGRTVQVYARNPSSDYWYIRNPDSPSEFCWVWAEYATFSGMVSTVPVFTPPPTATPTLTSTPHPGFDPAFGGLEHCAASGWWIDVDLENTGTLTFQSVSLTVKDTVTGTALTSVSNGFVDNTGCGSTTKRKGLGPGKTVGHSSPKFDHNLNGHKLRAMVTLCSGTGLNGTCVTETIVVTP